MMYDLARVERQHLANNKGPVFSLIRKRCACGKASTVKQLSQHGKCAACALESIRAAILPGDLIKLHHMLGAANPFPRSKWGWRNFYCVNCTEQDEAMQRLVAAGLAAIGYAGARMCEHYFHATRLGCKVVGLNAACIKNAMEGLA